MDKDNTILKKAADTLVLCGYAKEIFNQDNWSETRIQKDIAFGECFFDVEYDQDTLEGRRQLDAIFWHLINGRESFELTGLGHLDHHEQIIEHVKEELSK